ncbi:hypothetical protein [Liquorilactobacillus oeni]|uniref:Arc-like DNA binding domain-containing protein n=1 Tax=Liquorilactobacillus oeni DSM 19972 TaxID=1423777 RepID=A0A0R1MBQ9_9LACO|nr:hypothetical protein [Liquorilactobacillus oeni]KRL05446.1 hypothetical protein FD46_GL000861 [Liquorilactobacillus oeni DSM 19972]
MEKTAAFLLRIPQDLKKGLEKRAAEQNQSVNGLLQTMIVRELAKQDDQVTDDSLENRQFIGQTLTGSQVDSENGLVQVKGIFYRYLIESNLKFDPAKDYIVIEANGNILTLRPIVR